MRLLRYVTMACASTAIASTFGCGGDGNGGNRPKTEAELCEGVSDPCLGIATGPGAGDRPMTERLQGAFLQAQDMAEATVVIGRGTFDIGRELSLMNVDDVTVRGQGPGPQVYESEESNVPPDEPPSGPSTVLDFADASGGGGAGIKAEGGTGFTLENIAVEDTGADGVFVNSVTNVTLRNVRMEWTNGPDMNNGKYSIYPLKCENVLVENVTAIGASDAGIYVGQSANIIVRDSRTEANVAGIQIENSLDSEVYNNVTTGNSGGLMVFDLPGKEKQKNGARHRIHDNTVIANNQANFAAMGAFVNILPAGLGSLIMGTADVEFFDNEIRDNQTGNLAVVSYFIAGNPAADTEYIPFPTSVYVHDNTFSGGGDMPDTSSDAGLALQIFTSQALSSEDPIPHMAFDDVAPGDDPLGLGSRYMNVTPVMGTPDETENPQYICFQGNEFEDDQPQFLDLDAGAIDFADPINTIDQASPTTDISPFGCEGRRQSEVTLPMGGPGTGG